MENGLQVSLAVVKTSGKISYGLDCPFSSKSFGILKTNIKKIVKLSKVMMIKKNPTKLTVLGS